MHLRAVQVDLNSDLEEVVEWQLEQHCDRPLVSLEEAAEGVHRLSLGLVVVEVQVLCLEAEVEGQKICARR